MVISDQMPTMSFCFTFILMRVFSPVFDNDKPPYQGQFLVVDPLVLMLGTSPFKRKKIEMVVRLVGNSPMFFFLQRF